MSQPRPVASGQLILTSLQSSPRPGSFLQHSAVVNRVNCQPDIAQASVLSLVRYRLLASAEQHTVTGSWLF